MKDRVSITSRIALIAARQGGVVSRGQLLGAGLSSGTIARRRRSLWLLPVCPGVYAVGRQISSEEGAWMAGVLAAGPGACLARHCAAALWGLSRWSGPVEVVRKESRNPARSMLGPPGLASGRMLEVRRSGRLAPSQLRVRQGIPVTSAARTLLDLAGVEGEERFRKIFNEADRLDLLKEEEVAQCLAVSGGRKGAALMRRTMETRDPVTSATRSELEVMFLDLIQEFGLPRPLVNETVCGLEVDCFWPRQGLVVELDGFEFHRGRMAFERDLGRDKRLKLAGHRVVRLSYRMVRDEGREVAELIRRELAG